MAFTIKLTNYCVYVATCNNNKNNNKKLLMKHHTSSKGTHVMLNPALLCFVFLYCICIRPRPCHGPWATTTLSFTYKVCTLSYIKQCCCNCIGWICCFIVSLSMYFIFFIVYVQIAILYKKKKSFFIANAFEYSIAGMEYLKFKIVSNFYHKKDYLGNKSTKLW